VWSTSSTMAWGVSLMPTTLVRNENVF
jgi:hypothetical protein